MLRSFIALALLFCAFSLKEPTWAVAAGLFELAGVLHAVTRPIRLKEVKTDERKDRSSGGYLR